jgi:hypothetical protein
VDEEIRYTLNLVDNISPSLSRIEASQGKLATQVDATTVATIEQRVGFLTQVQAVRSLDMGFRGLSNVVIQTGIVGGKTARSLQTMGLAIHGVASAFQLLKGARMILMSLRSAEIGLAAVETYRSVLHNPAKLLLVGLALGAGAGAVGYYAGSHQGGGKTEVNQTVNFTGYSSSSDQRETARGTLDVMGG